MLPYQTGTVRLTFPYGRRKLFGQTKMHRGIDLVGGTAGVSCAPYGGSGAFSQQTDADVFEAPVERTGRGVVCRRSLWDGVLFPPVV